jgi:hypothetical protein
MASITASSVAVRAVVGRKTFLAGNNRVACAAPKTVNKARFTVRAADEVRVAMCISRTTRTWRSSTPSARRAMPVAPAFARERIERIISGIARGG